MALCIRIHGFSMQHSHSRIPQEAAITRYVEIRPARAIEHLVGLIHRNMYAKKIGHTSVRLSTLQVMS